MRTCARSSRKIMRTILKSLRNAPRKALTLRKNKIKMVKARAKKAKLTRMRKTIKWEIAKTTSLPTSLA